MFHAAFVDYLHMDDRPAAVWPSALRADGALRDVDRFELVAAARETRAYIKHGEPGTPGVDDDPTDEVEGQTSADAGETASMAGRYLLERAAAWLWRIAEHRDDSF